MEIDIADMTESSLSKLTGDKDPLAGDRLMPFEVASFYGSRDEIKRDVVFHYKGVVYRGKLFLHCEYLLPEKMAELMMQVMQVRIKNPNVSQRSGLPVGDSFVYSIYLKPSDKRHYKELAKRKRNAFKEPSKSRSGEINRPATVITHEEANALSACQ